MKRYLILALFGLIFGAFTGYFGEWISHHIARFAYSGVDDPWYWWLALPSLPGDAFVFRFFNLSDSYLDDEWDYRWYVTLFNGLQWMVIVPMFSFYFYLAKCLWRDTKSVFRRRFSR
jgi:hypothetical protein